MPIDARLSSALTGRYRLERELGSGGMATVYQAHDQRHGRPVAIKVLHPEVAASVGVERFLAEIHTTAKLWHPNILPLFDSGTEGGILYYVMPLVIGESLRARRHDEALEFLRQAVEIRDPVLGALALHSPPMAKLRRSPEFADIITALGTRATSSVVLNS